MAKKSAVRPADSIFASIRQPGRRPKSAQALPAAVWVGPDIAAAHIGLSLPGLWRGVAAGRITPPSYPTEKSPRFHLPTLDADMERARALPTEHEAGRRAARLAEARRQKREARTGSMPVAET